MNCSLCFVQLLEETLGDVPELASKREKITGLYLLVFPCLMVQLLEETLGDIPELASKREKITGL